MKKAYQHPVAAGPSPFIVLDHDQVARIMVDSVRPYCVMCYDPPPRVWADMGQQERQQYLSIVVALVEDPTMDAGRYHAGVAARMASEGWVYSPVPDILGKAHPLVAPWLDLTSKYRSRQCFLFAIARQLLNPG